MSAHSIVPPAADQSRWSTFFPNAGCCQLWKALAGLFLIGGLIGLLDRAWTISSDLEARRTWPSAQGKIVSAEQRDDSNLSLKSGSLSNRTRYWVEYEVKFVVAESQCRTGAVYIEPNGTTSCHGVVRTRSTQSTRQAFGWLLHGYHRNQPVTVVYDSNGPQIKVVGEPLWLRYNLETLMGNVLWVIVFSSLYAFARRRLEYFKRNPGAEMGPSEYFIGCAQADITQPQPDATGKHKLTTLDLS